MAGWYEFAISGAVQTVEFAAANMTSTSHFELPAGTTAQRPGTPVAGDTRYNASDDAFEVYCGATKGWVQLLPGSSSPLTTKGDLWGYGTADARVPVGSNSALLVADSALAQGVGWKKISDFNGFGSTFDADDMILIQDATDNVVDSIDLGALFGAMTIPQALSAEVTVQQQNPTDTVNFKEESTGAGSVILAVLDSGGGAIFNVSGGANNDHVQVGGANTDFVQMRPYFTLPEQASSPSTPATGTGAVYCKTDQKLYFKDKNGVETDLTGGGTSTDYAKGHETLYAKDIVTKAFDTGLAVFQYGPPELQETLGEGVLPHARCRGEDNQDIEREFGLMIQVPRNYDPSSHTLTVNINCRLSRATSGTSYVDIQEAQVGVNEGTTPGADINTTGRQTVTTTWGVKTFTLTDTGLDDTDALWLNICYQILDGGGGGGEVFIDINKIYVRVN